MAPRLIIQSITGTTPFEFYVCDIAESVCFYIGSVSGTSTNYLTLPSIFATAPIIMIKMIDSSGCEVKKNLSCDFTCGFDLIVNAADCTFCVTISPIPASPTPTPSQTPTNTPTPSITPTITPSISLTPTNTPTPTSTPIYYLLQENGFYILQEDGSKIIIT